MTGPRTRDLTPEPRVHDAIIYLRKQGYVVHRYVPRHRIAGVDMTDRHLVNGKVVNTGGMLRIAKNSGWAPPRREAS